MKTFLKQIQNYQFTLLFFLLLFNGVTNFVYGQPPSPTSPRSYTPGGIFNKVFDRLGNPVPIEQIRRTQVSVSGPQSFGPSCTSGYFDIDFAPGCGMDGSSPAEVAMRDVVCKVFLHLSQFINPVNSGNHVRILIGNPNSIPSGSSWLAFASPYYCVPLGATYQSAIVDNKVWETINSGVDAWTNVGVPVLPTSGGSGAYYHGLLVFNFPNYPTSVWHTDLSSNPSAALMDMYTITLHEAIHLFGFESLIGSTGNSVFNGQSGNYYNRYDQHLQSSTGLPLISNSGACNMYNYGFNASLTNAISPNPSLCISDFTTCSSAIKYVGSSGSTPVYTPNCWEDGSSLSHFEDLCVAPNINNGTYVMSNGTPFGLAKRHLLTEERSVLCDIGYSVNTTFGEVSCLNAFNYTGSVCPDIGVVGINDGITGTGMLTYSVPLGGTISIPISTIMSNDYFENPINAGIECVQEVYGMGIATLGGTNIQFTAYPVVSGITVIRYVPKLGSGQRGNVTYIFVYISDPACTGAPTLCNMVPNSGFESNNGLCGAIDFPISTGGPIRHIDCWHYSAATPDLLTYGCTVPGGSYATLPCNFSSPPADTYNGPTNNNAAVGFFGYIDPISFAPYEEWVWTGLSTPVTVGNTYTFKCKARLANLDWATNLPNQSIVQYGYLGILLGRYPGSFIWDVNYSVLNLLPPAGSAVTPFDFYVVDPGVAIPNNNGWNQVSITFTATYPYDMSYLHLGFSSDNYTPAEGMPYMYIDDVELIPAAVSVNFTGMPSCGDLSTVLTNMFQYVNVNTGVFSGPGITGTGVNTTFDASLAGVGNHVITFTYTNPTTGCLTTTISSIYIQNIQHNVVSACPPYAISFTGAVNYTWSPTNALTYVNPDGSSVIANPSVNTIYTVTATGVAGLCPTTFTFPLGPTPSVALVSSSPCVPSTLVATAGYPSYTWTNPNSNVTTGSFTFSATIPGTYSVQVANISGCTASASINVGIQASITSSSGQHCTPNELHAWPQVGGYNYYWSVPAGAPTPPAPLNGYNYPSTTIQGTYSVIVVDGNGCTSSATFFLSNGPTGLAINSTLTGAPCTNTQTVQLTATVNSTSIQPFDYSWTGPSSTNFSNTIGSPFYSNSVVWNPLIGTGTFTVTVTDAWHCSNSTSLFVNPQNTNNLFCCSQAATSIAANSSTFLEDDVTSSSTGYTVMTGATVFIDGIFTVNQTSFTFKNCTVYLTPNSRIEVLANCTLKITNGSLLRAAPNCNMWDGIYASDPSSQVEINSSSTLRDMENGVVISNQGKLVTSDAWYKDNYTSIHLKNLPSTYSGSIERCTFMKSTGLIAPWVLVDKPKHGMVIENCKYATVGNLTNSTGGNTFNDLWNGIYMHTTLPFTATPSTILIYFNKFTNITGGVGFGAPPPAPTDNNMYTNPDGCAIFGDNKDKKYNISTRIFGNTGSSTIVNFDNCNKAIILNSFNGRINSNRSSLTNAGILLNQTEGKSMEVLSNTLNGVRLGISNVGNAQNFHTDNNTVTLSTVLQSLGITSTYPTPVNTGITQMHGNTIEIPGLDYATGIGLYSGSNDDIQFNEIHFSNTSNIASISSAPTLLGMKLTLNMGTWINGNTITGVNNSNFYNQRRVAAMYMHKNQKNLIDCNIANYLQFGIYAVGDNSTGYYDRVRNNVFTTQTAGLLLRHLSNEGTLGDIGYENSAPPYDKYDGNNRFHGNNTLNKVYRFTTCSSLTFDKILTQATNLVQTNSTNSTGNPGCNYKVFNPIFNSNEIYWCTPPNYITGCGNGGAIPNPDLHDIQTAIKIAEDTRQYSEFIEGGKWLDRRMLYDWLNRDSTIRVNNPILDSFYLSYHTREIEHLWIVDELIGRLTDSTIMESEQEWNDILSQARSENDGVATTELFAANEKWINNIYLNYLEAGLDTISQEEFGAIQTLAESCPYTEGSAVFKARGIYAMFVPGVDYDDMEICNNIGVYKGGKSLYDQENELLSGKVNNFIAEDLMVYPNPASDILTLEYSLYKEIKGELKILDMLGNIVQKIKISSNLNKVTFNLNKLSAGIYVYKFINDEKTTYSGKLIIE